MHFQVIDARIHRYLLTGKVFEKFWDSDSFPGFAGRAVALFCLGERELGFFGFFVSWVKMFLLPHLHKFECFSAFHHQPSCALLIPLHLLVVFVLFCIFLHPVRVWEETRNCVCVFDAEARWGICICTENPDWPPVDLSQGEQAANYLNIFAKENLAVVYFKGLQVILGKQFLCQIAVPHCRSWASSRKYFFLSILKLSKRVCSSVTFFWEMSELARLKFSKTVQPEACFCCVKVFGIWMISALVLEIDLSYACLPFKKTSGLQSLLLLTFPARNQLDRVNSLIREILVSWSCYSCCCMPF